MITSMWGTRGAVVLVLLVAGCGGSSVANDQAPRPVVTPTACTIGGTLAVTGGLPANGREGAACTTPTAYRDVVAGAPVVVTDHLMKTIAVGRLEPGRLVRVSGERHCVFPFAVPDVPTGQPFYRVVFADRRPRWYDEPQARAGISLTVG
jgi:hypothetical protein